MEVFSDPPVFVKAQKLAIREDKLRLTNIDRVFYHYRCILLVYRSIGAKLGEANDAVKALRHGVEEILTHYPWAAGRIEAHDGQRPEAICLTGEVEGGIQFVSACANCTLAQLGDLADPNPAFEPLFATVDLTAPLHSRPLVALQVTRFQDDGVCVSMNTSHALFDGVSAAIFLQNIFSCARGDGLCKFMDTVPRELRIKPAKMEVQSTTLQQENWPSFLQKILTTDWNVSYQSVYSQPLATTRFKFGKEDLARLQEEALSKQEDCGVGFNRCSRFEALAAHLWKAKAKSLMCQDAAEEFSLWLAVNVRGNIVASPPLCNYMGNAVSTAMPSATVRELAQNSLAFAVEKIQEAMKEVNAERFQTEVNYLGMVGRSARLLPPRMNIASLVGVGFSEADFG